MSGEGRDWCKLVTALHRGGSSSPPSTAAAATDDEAEWAFASLKTLRPSMLSPKLSPPVEVFALETASVLLRDSPVAAGGALTVLDATRVVLRYVRYVEASFGEIRFGVSVLTDHNPAEGMKGWGTGQSLPLEKERGSNS